MIGLKAKLIGITSLALATGGLMLGSAPANAAATVPAPAITNDANAANGNLAFFNSSGAPVTSGTNLSHLFDFAQASTAGRAGATKATVYFAFPDHTQADSNNWFSQQVSTPTSYPNSTFPAPLNGSNPVTKFAAADANLGALLSSTTLDTTSGYQGIVQVRLYDTGPTVSQDTVFWATDIYFDQAANTWQQVFPHVVSATSTTLSANPNPSTVGDSVTLTATEAPATAGSVQFKDGANNIGSPVAVNGSGVATATVSTLAQGSHALSAVFTPTDTANFGSSTGTFSATVNPAATHTTTTLAIGGSPTVAGSDTTLTATVSPSAAAGTVAFFDNGSSTALPGTVDSSVAGTYVLDLPTGFTAGSHSIVAKFTPTSLTAFAVSQSAPSTFLTQAAAVGACAQPGSVCTDQQFVQATVPVGTLVISTPYVDAAHALDLGTLALSPDSTQLQGHATFANIVVTDTRSGNLPWTVSALASNLTDGGSNPGSVINNQNLGLTAITATPGTGFTGTVVATNNPAAAGVAPADPGVLGLGGTTSHTVATANHGLGTVTMQGTLSLNAPSSTEPGLFTGTITFTVG